ncbi:MAG: hypothetical protein IJW82_00995 [Clostridia bacterium]|nr:hypothetical protein [Clostridia bacterium]
MGEKELNELVSIFKGYRDLLLPIQKSLNDFVESFGGLKTNLEGMNQLFEGDINGKLDKIYTTLYSQSQKSTDLSSRIDVFVKNTDKHLETITKLSTKLESIEQSLNRINELEAVAEGQIKKLDDIIQEKKINYNVKDLQRSLESYNINVQKVSDFINKDVAEKLKENNEKILQLKNENTEIKALIENQSKDIVTMIEYFKATGEYIKTAVEEEGINEEYLFEILDKWAVSRKIKIK